MLFVRNFSTCVFMNYFVIFLKDSTLSQTLIFKGKKKEVSLGKFEIKEILLFKDFN